MTRGRRATSLVMAVGLALAACGGDGESRFAARTDAVRAAVAAGDAQTARAELDQLAVDAFVARDEGAIDDQELSELASLIATAEEQVDALLVVEETSTTTEPPTTTTSTTTAPPPVEVDDDDDDDDDKPGRGNSKKDDDD